MRGIPISPVEYANGFFIFDGQVSKEAYEANLIIYLGKGKLQYT